MPRVSDIQLHNRKRLLIVCGPTATGKTKLAVDLARRFDGELVSADSRQIYREVSIVSGKDISEGSRMVKRLTVDYRDKTYQLGTYDFSGIPLWLYDIVSVSDSFSVSHYHAISSRVISDILNRGKLPVVVGGTGLYVKALVSPPETRDIPPDFKRRRQWNSMTVRELQNALLALQPLRFSSMNQSDRANPRRLIRALEISLWRTTHPPQISKPVLYDSFWVGLRPDVQQLRTHIYERVVSRWEKGALNEVKECLRTAGDMQVADIALAVAPVREYVRGTMTASEALDAWTQEEYSYAKRQMTWFTKMGEIHWYDAWKFESIESVVKDVGAWYTYTKE